MVTAELGVLRFLVNTRAAKCGSFAVLPSHSRVGISSPIQPSRGIHSLVGESHPCISMQFAAGRHSAGPILQLQTKLNVRIRVWLVFSAETAPVPGVTLFSVCQTVAINAERSTFSTPLTSSIKEDVPGPTGHSKRLVSTFCIYVSFLQLRNVNMRTCQIDL